MKRNFGLITLSLFIAVFFVLDAGFLNAEDTSGSRGKILRFHGEVKAVNCAAGELRLVGGRGEAVFYLGKEVKFKNIKGCGDIAPQGMAVVSYSESEGKKTVISITFMQKNPRSETRGTKQLKSVTGWVTDVNCEKATVTVGDMEDKSRVETFYLSERTRFDPKHGINGCKDIKKGTVMSLIYDEQDGKKDAKRIKIVMKEVKSKS